MSTGVDFMLLAINLCNPNATNVPGLSGETILPHSLPFDICSHKK